MKQINISANSFRFPKEKLALRFSLITLGFAWLFFEIITLGPRIPITIPLIITLSAAFVMIRFKQNALKGQCVLISQKQMPDLYRLIVEASQNLQFPQPNVYIQQNHELNAFAIGLFNSNAVVLTSELVHGMTETELQFIIGHELAHLKCNHVFWQIIGTENRFFRLPILDKIILFFMQWWSRQAEYTADRGGLLACRDLEAATTALAKLSIGYKLFSKLNIDEMMRQITGSRTQMGELFATHPFVANRIKGLVDFFHSEQYRRLVNG